MTESRLRELLLPYVTSPELGPEFLPAERGSPASLVLPDDLYAKLNVYLELLLRWNARMNLTAIREPEEIVTRHFGEGLFAALRLTSYIGVGTTLLDVGSGAGFPGLPIQLALPSLQVTLAESQGKKAAFLREAVRVLGLSTEVWGRRTEAIPAERRFHIVTARAVDRMQEIVAASMGRLVPGGVFAELTSAGGGAIAGMVEEAASAAVPGSNKRVLRLWRYPPA